MKPAQAITAEDVLWCYENILLRKAESKEAVETHLKYALKHRLTRQELERDFYLSDEYKKLLEIKKDSEIIIAQESDYNSINETIKKIEKKITFNNLKNKLLYKITINRRNHKYLSSIGINLHGDYGENNILYLENINIRYVINITFSQKSSDNTFIIKNRKLSANIVSHGNGNLFIAEESEYNFSVTVHYYGKETLCYIDRNCSANSLALHIYGPKTSIIIASDCMFSWGISIFDSDAHELFDIFTLEKINFNKSVLINTHVWIGCGVTILKGVELGSGSVVGANSTVTQNIPKNVVAAGTPCKIIRKNTSWSRPLCSNIDERKRIVEWISCDGKKTDSQKRNNSHNVYSDYSIVQDWAKTNFDYWKDRKIDTKNYRNFISEISKNNPQIVIFDINGTSISVSPSLHINDQLDLRVSLYSSYLLKILNICNFTGSFKMPICIGDIPPDDRFEYPIFSFDKSKGTEKILIPDIDYILTDSYNTIPKDDPNQYKNKLNRAVFAGSTTGGKTISINKIKEKRVPRLRAAEFFKNSNLVDFKITHICQVDGALTNQYIQNLGVLSDRISWEEQLKNKFLISMDGNGATWSRIVKILYSNSVLLKYLSSRVQFFYGSLIKDLHYIQITEDSEIIKIVQEELSNPGRFESVALAGTEFAKKNLTNEKVDAYLIDVLHQFSKLFI